MIPTLGRIVLVHLGRNVKRDGGPPVFRPAIVVRVWGDTPDAAVNVQLFCDGSNDLGCEYLTANGIDPSAPRWLTSLTGGVGIGQWSWPPRAA